MAQTQTYVDPSINANSGTGTVGDPYGDLQYALDTMTRDSTNGDQINIKAGTAEVLTGSLDFTTYGTPDHYAALSFSGYTSVENDGGTGSIDGDGLYKIASLPSYTVMKDLELFNTGSNQVISGSATRTSLINCELHTQSGGSYSVYNISLYGCHLHDMTSSSGMGAVNCYGCGLFDVGYYLFQGYQAIRNISVITTTARAIFGHNQGYVQCIGNTVLCNGGVGLSFTGSAYSANIYDNLIEGASTGIYFSTTDSAFIAGNAVYNSSVADYDMRSNAFGTDVNESLSASPFEKTGAATWANAKAYFAPANVGNVRTGAISNFDGVKGAINVQPTAGGGGSTVHPLYAN